MLNVARGTKSSPAARRVAGRGTPLLRHPKRPVGPSDWSDSTVEAIEYVPGERISVICEVSPGLIGLIESTVWPFWNRAEVVVEHSVVVDDDRQQAGADPDVLGLQAVLAQLDPDGPIAADHLGVAARRDQQRRRQEECELRCAQPCHGDAIMIPPSMSRPVKVLFITVAAVVAAALAPRVAPRRSASPKSDPNHAGAVLFNQRCSGCHTLSYAATHGSAANARNREIVNGPELRPAL